MNLTRSDYITVFIGGLLTFVILSSAAFAGEKIPTINCEAVRTAVAEHGRIKAIRWARGQGYSWAQINDARRCLR